jgi:redox-sensing transcriptional repressor
MLPEFIENNSIDIGILCLPKNSAQEVANIFIEKKVPGIWNFAPADLEVPEEIAVENVHLSESLMVLSYRLNESNLLDESK